MRISQINYEYIDYLYSYFTENSALFYFILFMRCFDTVLIRLSARMKYLNSAYTISNQNISGTKLL